MVKKVLLIPENVTFEELLQAIKNIKKNTIILREQKYSIKALKIAIEDRTIQNLPENFSFADLKKIFRSKGKEKKRAISKVKTKPKSTKTNKCSKLTNGNLPKPRFDQKSKQEERKLEADVLFLSKDQAGKIIYAYALLHPILRFAIKDGAFPSNKKLKELTGLSAEKIDKKIKTDRVVRLPQYLGFALKRQFKCGQNGYEGYKVQSLKDFFEQAGLLRGNGKLSKKRCAKFLDRIEDDKNAGFELLIQACDEFEP